LQIGSRLILPHPKLMKIHLGWIGPESGIKGLSAIQWPYTAEEISNGGVGVT